jgi:outer membrane protein TolC
MCLQTARAQITDSILTYEQFLLQVYEYHPVAKQVNLKRAAARYYLTKAQGGFDPKLNAQWDSKQFKDKRYYDILNAHLDVPIWNGIGVEGGYNYTRGEYLNPENNLPQNGQAYLGIKVSLLKGLWTDDRRAAIQQAKLLGASSEVDIELAMNDLLYEAAKAYWEWTKAYNQWKIVRESLSVLNEQYRITTQLTKQGDIPAIDTLKAFIQVQDRTVLLQEYTLQLTNSALAASFYLWDSVEAPLVIDEMVTFPVILAPENVVPLDEELLNNAIGNINDHPYLRYYDFKMQSLAIDRRLKINKLLPKLDLKYNFLATNGGEFFSGSDYVGPGENYKLGIKFSVPIFLRKERMDLKLNQLKQREVGYMQVAKQQELKIKIENYFNSIQNYASQTELTESMVGNYQTLFQAERTKLKFGESSLFLINTRESQLLDARQKLIKQQINYLKSKTAFNWSAAQFGFGRD